ncbi:MAG: hypothetical protein LAT84_01395 [Balneolia bacterium]|nr:hypothetical protein [Balneolia bacterium]
MKTVINFTVVVLSLSAFLLLQPIASDSGEANAQHAEFGLNLQLGLPQGPFQDQLDEIGFGIQGMAGYHIPFTPVMFGLDLGFFSFATDSRSEPLSSTIPDVRVIVENSYNMAHGHFLTRLSGQNYYFKPYMDLLVGFNYLYTQSSVRSSIGSQQDVFTDTNFDDFAFSYGIGAGMRFLVWDGSSLGQGRAFVNAQVRYMVGSEAEYIQPGSISTGNGNFTFDTSTSRTDLLSFQLGVSFMIP